MIRARYTIEYGGIVFANLRECIEDDDAALREYGGIVASSWNGTKVTYEVEFETEDGWSAREHAEDTLANLCLPDCTHMEKVE